MVLYLVTVADASTWRVSVDGFGDAPTIQAAIDSSVSGDSIIVGPGTYHENPRMIGKHLVLLGERGARETIIDGGRRGGVVQMSSGTVQGFTITNGLAGSGGGIWVGSGGHVVLRFNIIERNFAGLEADSGFGGGIFVSNTGLGPVSLVIDSNTIRQNAAGFGGGGILDTGHAVAQITSNIIVNNAAHVSGGAIISNGNIVGNLVANNTCDLRSAGIVTGNGLIERNTIAYNKVGQNFRGYAIWADGAARILNNIIVGNGSNFGNARAAISCSNSILRCNNIWGNNLDAVAGTGNIEENFSLDPQFCGTSPEVTLNYELQQDSPCAPGADPISGSCGQIGAKAVGCGTVSVKSVTWRQIKQMYR